jgi:hypothetical protein
MADKRPKSVVGSTSQTHADKVVGGGTNQDVAQRFLSRICTPRKNASQDELQHRRSLRDSAQRVKGPQPGGRPGKASDVGGADASPPLSKKKR